jgi:hypothetical protein
MSLRRYESMESENWKPEKPRPSSHLAGESLSKLASHNGNTRRSKRWAFDQITGILMSRTFLGSFDRKADRTVLFTNIDPVNTADLLDRGGSLKSQ